MSSWSQEVAKLLLSSFADHEKIVAIALDEVHCLLKW